MARVNPSGPRVFVRFPQEQYDQFVDWAKQLGVPMTHLIAMCAWTGSHTLIPRMLPDVHTQLELIQQQVQEERYQLIEQVMSDEEKRLQQEFQQFQDNREEFQQWLQQGSLHKDETGKEKTST